MEEKGEDDRAGEGQGEEGIGGTVREREGGRREGRDRAGWVLLMMAFGLFCAAGLGRSEDVWKGTPIPALGPAWPLHPCPAAPQCPAYQLAALGLCWFVYVQTS